MGPAYPPSASLLALRLQLAVARGSRSRAGSESLCSAQALLMRPLLCFSRARLRSGLLRFSFLGSHLAFRGSLVLLSLAFLLHRLVPGYGPDRLLGSALHVFGDAFDACVGSRLIRHDRLLSFPPCSGALAPPQGTDCYPAIWGTNAAAGSRRAPLRGVHYGVDAHEYRLDGDPWITPGLSAWPASSTR
jgi:hypothetical protein